jgi:AcrR family transcriptional regulator
MLTDVDLICGIASSVMFPLALENCVRRIPVCLNTDRKREIVSRTQNAVHQQLRAAQKRWLNDICQRHSVTLTEIARRATMNPSTLTQFYNREERAGTLQTFSIRRIADAMSEAVPPEVIGETELRGFAEVEATPYQAQAGDPVADAVRAFIAGRDHLIPWELRTRALEPAGFAPGDVLIMDLNGDASPGDVVCAQVYDWQAGRAETVFRVLEPPFLVGAGDDAWRKPLPARDPSVAIKAVMLMSFRRRTARGAAA